jgi:hypothetical protein
LRPENQLARKAQQKKGETEEAMGEKPGIVELRKPRAKKQ